MNQSWASKKDPNGADRTTPYGSELTIYHSLQNLTQLVMASNAVSWIRRWITGFVSLVGLFISGRVVGGSVATFLRVARRLQIFRTVVGQSNTVLISRCSQSRILLLPLYL